MLTLKKVNSVLETAKFPLELVKGEGYFYFVYDAEVNGRDVFETSSVMVYRVNHMSLASWVAEAEAFLDKMAILGLYIPSK